MAQKGGIILFAFKKTATSNALDLTGHVNYNYLITEDKPHVLIIKSPANKWSIPKGQREKRNKNIIETAMRELYEETGIERHMYYLLESPTYRIDNNKYYYGVIKPEFVDSYKILNRREVAEIKWVSLDDLQASGSIYLKKGNRGLVHFIDKIKRIPELIERLQKIHNTAGIGAGEAEARAGGTGGAGGAGRADGAGNVMHALSTGTRNRGKTMKKMAPIPVPIPNEATVLSPYNIMNKYGYTDPAILMRIMMASNRNENTGAENAGGAEGAGVVLNNATRNAFLKTLKTFANKKR